MKGLAGEAGRADPVHGFSLFMVLAVSVTYSMSLPRRQLDVWGLELRGELWERNTDGGSSTHRW